MYLDSDNTYNPLVSNAQRVYLNEYPATRILLRFIKILAAAVTMVYLHSLPAKYFYVASGYDIQTATTVTTKTIRALPSGLRFGRT